MPTEVIMPKVDMDMASGKIMTWHVAEGETVSAGDPLFDIETDKAAMEVEAPTSGVLYHTAPEGAEIPIGTPCGWLYAEGEDVGDQPKPFASGVIASAQAKVDEPVDQLGVAEIAPTISQITQTETFEPDLHSEAHGKTRATPRARALAAQSALDLSTISGTGPRGRVQTADVEVAHDTRVARPVESRARFRAETGPLAVSRSKGGSGTPIVLIHGFASDATSWAPLESFIKDRPMFRIDLPGHGKSPKLRIDSFLDLVKELRRTFDGLGIDKAELVGHSLGGALCIALADTRLKSVSSLSLIAPAGLGPDINGQALSGICNAGRAESLGPWLRSLVAQEDLITDSYTRLAMASRQEPNLRAAQVAFADAVFPDGVQSFDLRAALKRIDAPTRIIWGKQDKIIPWKHALQAPGKAALHLFDGVGHMPHIECPQDVAKIIRGTG